MTKYSKEQADTQFAFVETALSDVAQKAENLHAIIDQYGSTNSEESHVHIRDIIFYLGQANGLLYRIRYDWEKSLTTNPEWDEPHG
jgi:hypothetical protein